LRVGRVLDLNVETLARERMSGPAYDYSLAGLGTK